MSRGRDVNVAFGKIRGLMIPSVRKNCEKQINEKDGSPVKQTYGSRSRLS